MPAQINNVIASRTMTWTRADGATFPVNVYIGNLVFVPSTDATLAAYWQASVQIVGPGIDGSIRTCSGDDSVQALYHALANAGMIISSSIIASQLDYSVVPNFGFPVFSQQNPPPAN